MKLYNDANVNRTVTLECPRKLNLAKGQQNICLHYLFNTYMFALLELFHHTKKLFTVFNCGKLFNFLFCIALWDISVHLQHTQKSTACGMHAFWFLYK